MSLTDAQKRANQKYNAKAYDQIKVLVKKGEREKIKKFAETKGMSLNSYIKNLIEQDMNLSD